MTAFVPWANLLMCQSLRRALTLYLKQPLRAHWPHDWRQAVRFYDAEVRQHCDANAPMAILLRGATAKAVWESPGRHRSIVAGRSSFLSMALTSREPFALRSSRWPRPRFQIRDRARMKFLLPFASAITTCDTFAQLVSARRAATARSEREGA